MTTSSVLNGSQQIVSGSLGTGGLNLTGGTIQSSSAALLQSGVAAVTLANPITLANAGLATALNIGGAAAANAMLFGTTLTFSGAVTVNGNSNHFRGVRFPRRSHHHRPRGARRVLHRDHQRHRSVDHRGQRRRHGTRAALRQQYL